jgi:uncharacterized protein YigE (DUF2233 family)
MNSDYLKIVLPIAVIAILFFVGCDQTGTIISMQNIDSEKTPSYDAKITELKWTTIAPGSEYGIFQMDLSSGTAAPVIKDFLVVRIDPKKNEFEIYENKEKKKAKTIEDIHAQEGAIITFNGSFFTDDFKPTGLIVNKGNKLNKLSSANLLDGIIAVDENGNVHFFDQLGPKKFATEEKYEFAIQNGPILLDEKREIKIKSDDGKTASRTAMGIDKNGKIVLVMIKQNLLNLDNSISLYGLAKLLKEGPIFEEMGLHSVLNLDGGSSTGLKIGTKYFPEMEKVQNVVLVKLRQ